MNHYSYFKFLITTHNKKIDTCPLITIQKFKETINEYQ